ncbi:hypothetical protein [Rhodopirellula sp. P2]|uniref:hypothetical protein n=1 Tax=Rhodopirellula sp. P2 TaxID=2127060 RepID=UPI002367A464|nr:hypothetical protein [Rhodopirellula sp. P2]WDQ16065.1 hypothetical protein PSR62_20885 [Rhodopirellula sp. P2]
MRRVMPFTIGGDCRLGFFRCPGFFGKHWKWRGGQGKLDAFSPDHKGVACSSADVLS